MFKIGDKVVIIDDFDDFSDCKYTGKVGKISAIGYDGNNYVYRVYFKDTDETALFTDDEFDLYEGEEE